MSAALRIQHHQAGADLMRSGEYFRALTTLQEALMSYGPHVGLLSDLVAVLYLLGRIEDCASMALRLENELRQSGPLLSKESQAKTFLFLGKIREEQGCVQKALSHYSQAVELSREQVEIRVRAQAQLLRLQSFLGLRTGLSELYQACFKLQSENLNLNIELEHALMLAEMTLFGVAFAEARLKKALNSKILSDADQLLLVVDYIEEAINQKGDQESVRSYIGKIDLSQADEFEKIVVSMASKGGLTSNPFELNLITKNLSLMGLFRILILNLKFSTADDVSDSYRRLFLFHLESLDADSKSLLLKKWQKHFETDSLVLQFDPETAILAYKEDSFHLKPGSFGAKCLSCFENQNSVPIEQFIAQVFEAQLDSSYFDRTRIALQRFNKELAVWVGVPKIFTAKKNCVEISAKVRIRFGKGEL